MRVVVDAEMCEGHALCASTVPDVFEVGDDDRAHVLNDDPSEDLRAAIESAIRTCPKQAIHLEE